MLEYTKLLFQINESILERKLRVMYLYPPPEAIGIEKIRELLQNRLDRAFQKVVNTHLKAYMSEGKEPPAAIAATIKNFADDMVAGREITVRSGDYFAIQNFAKSK